ncbi:hypothetical protein AT00_01085 [Pseudoalteromonas lipolytica SCSIO 04301]|nr:hypothetical protein AT00_01085 [Pseudoalteromonas lipolytica SCSIO 04301]
MTWRLKLKTIGLQRGLLCWVSLRSYLHAKSTESGWLKLNIKKAQSVKLVALFAYSLCERLV